jgi:glyoxylase-like metal-dependent hydrolase (beta-lactamase superfamily II)
VSSEKPYEVLPGIYSLGSAQVNWFLVEDGGSLTAVDAGLPGFYGGLASDLATLAIRVEDIHAVVLTHSDSDHTGLAPHLREAGARVLIHTDDQQTLSRPRPKRGDASPTHLIPHMWNPRLWSFMAHMARAGGAKAAKVDQAETFGDGESLDVPGAPRVIHTPGHTPGHCALHFERHGALFVGDAMCTWNPLSGKRGPQVMPKAFNVDTQECFRSLSAIETVAAQVVLPGHGEPFREGAAAAATRARDGNRR